MNDTQLGTLMRSLPRRKASPAFTSEVLRKVEDRESRTRVSALHFMWRTAAGVAMAACLVAVVLLGQMQYVRRTETAQLRAETKQLRAELQAVKQIASEPEPVVVFENTEGTRVIMDLDSAAQPASYRTFD